MSLKETSKDKDLEYSNLEENKNPQSIKIKQNKMNIKFKRSLFLNTYLFCEYVNECWRPWNVINMYVCTFILINMYVYLNIVRVN